MNKRRLQLLTLAIVIIASAIFVSIGIAKTPAVVPQVEQYGGLAISATTTYGSSSWGEFEYGDVFVDVDQTAVTTQVNTLTLTLQVAPVNEDGEYRNHTTSSALLTSNITDTKVYTRVYLHGYWWRIQATVANTASVTPTIWVVRR